MKFAQFMSSPIGRGARIVVGLVLAIIALASLFPAGNTVAGVILLLVGLFFIAVGVFNICILAPLFGGKVSSKRP